MLVWILIAVLLGLFVLWTFFLIYRRWQWSKASNVCGDCGHDVSMHGFYTGPTDRPCYQKETSCNQ